MTLKSINPYSGHVIYEFDEFSDNVVQRAIGMSYEAFRNLRNEPFRLRSGRMSKVAGVLKSRKEELAGVITSEMGKPIRESIAEIEKCAWLCEYYARNAAEFLKNEIIQTGADQSYVRYDPLGPVLAVMPWNFPFWQVFRFASPNIMAGNTALLKHASNVQQCALMIEAVFKEAGFPENIFKTLVIGSSLVKKVIMNERVKAVTLTGSEKAGESVAETAGRFLKKSVLELGGSNAFIVLDDADLDLAVETGVKARMQNAGQSCIAAKRFIVQKKVYDKYLDLFLNKVKQLSVGDPMDQGTDMGPLSSVRQAELVHEQVYDAISKGAALLLGGHRKGAFYEPTVLTNINRDMNVFSEEVFGPVASFFRVEDDNEALEAANDTAFGLGTTVMTSDPSRAGFFISGCDDGAVFINELVKSDPRLPFGGTKRSGYGRELSFHGIKEFMNTKTIYINQSGKNT